MLREGSRGDDVLRRRFVLQPRQRQIAEAERSVLAALQEQQYDAGACFAVRLALGEALANAFKHGNKDDPDKAVKLDCRVELTRIVIEIEDQGEGFDPEAVPNPTEQENLEIPSGRGIALMRSYMTDVSFLPPGNRVRLTYERRH